MLNTRKLLLIFTALASLGGGQSAFAQSSELSQELSMTIYGDGRALVEDVRDIKFERGRNTVILPGVSSKINAPSATFVADGIEIVEQNFDYDLLTPQKLMQKAVGETVTIVRTNPGTGVETRERAKVLAANNGVVVQIGDRIEVLRDDNLPTRVIFDGVPENLRANPTLSTMVHSQRTGTRKATLNYLSDGLNWRADYVMLFDEDKEKMDIQGWATLTNQTETTFKDTKVSLVAGHVGNQYTRNLHLQQNNNYNYNNYNRNNRSNRNNNVRKGGTESNPYERIGDNYLYPLPGRTTIASNQTKQVGFLSAENVDAKKVFEYQQSGFRTIKDPQAADVRIVFSNSRAADLGEALPKGIIRVYANDKRGRAQFIGEEMITHIPGGSELALKIGEAFDVNVKPTQTRVDKISKYVSEHDMEYEITNAKDEAVEVVIRQQLWGWRTEYKILSESHDSENPDAYSYVWTVKIPANGETTLKFKFRQDWSWSAASSGFPK